MGPLLNSLRPFLPSLFTQLRCVSRPAPAIPRLMRSCPASTFNLTARSRRTATRSLGSSVMPKCEQTDHERLRGQSGTSRQRGPIRPTIGNNRARPWRPDSSKMVSEIPGAVQGVSDPRLLVASHIVPWREDKTSRLNPSNGLCLSAIHDKAFDQHLFTLSDDCRIVLSSTLKQTPDRFLREVFWSSEGEAIEMPERFAPHADFIARHRELTLHEAYAGNQHE